MNPYYVLGVRKNSTSKEIDESFNRLSEKYNPKNYAGDQFYAKKRLNEILEAYNILSHEDLKLEYDSKYNKHIELQSDSKNSFNKNHEPLSYQKKSQYNPYEQINPIDSDDYDSSFYENSNNLTLIIFIIIALILCSLFYTLNNI